jgi:UDP-glucose:(heptosyl)LPS alpha-1,3-glucosyltransferase
MRSGQSTTAPKASRLSARPRIALCAHAVHDDGGMERAFAELIRHSAGRIDWTIVSADLQMDLRRFVTWKRVPVPAGPAPVRFVAFWMLAGCRLARVPRDALHTLGAITWTPADVVTVAFCHAAFATIAPGPGPGRSSSLRRANTKLHRALALWAERFCYRPGRVQVFGAVSPGVRRELALHYPGIPVALNPNGVDTARFRPDCQTRADVRAEHGIGGGEVVAVFVGGEWGRKGLAIAIRALAIAGDDAPFLKLWIVGDGDEASFRSLARELGVDDRVAFLGRRADVERYLQAADVFVFPTSYETFSIASYEAAASELPVLATPVSGIEDLIGADETGIATEAAPDAVAAGLVRLAEDPALRRRLGAAGRNRAREYSWERSAASVLDTYAAILGDGGAVRPRPGT